MLDVEQAFKACGELREGLSERQVQKLEAAAQWLRVHCLWQSTVELAEALEKLDSEMQAGWSDIETPEEIAGNGGVLNYAALLCAGSRRKSGEVT